MDHSFFTLLSFTRMVTVTAYQTRTAQDEHEYFALELTSDDLEMVISRQTGRYYATQLKCWISSTFTEAVCKLMVGRKLPGSIARIACEPYEFTIPETGEVITREHRYEYTVTEQYTSEPAVSQEPLAAA